MKKLLLTMASIASMTLWGQDMDITKIDTNFRQATVGKQAVKYLDITKSPFLLTGFGFRTNPDTPFNRLPDDFTEQDVNKGALALARQPSGAAVLFRTNSPFLALLSDPATGAAMSHMPATGVSGYDIYCRRPDHTERFIGNVRTTAGGAICQVGNSKKEMCDYIIYLPLYSTVKKLEIGIAPDCLFEAPTPQRFTKPICFYGSSITQGGCCSRPANNYSTMICRELDAAQINLGFSGSGRGEIAVAKAIAKLELSLFVMDYDHNAPNIEYLRNTHEPFFKVIREAHPELPILLLSAPNVGVNTARCDVIRKTYENAIAAGDKHVYFIPGHTLFQDAGQNFCTVDGCHPNDLGFYMMYKTCMPVIKKALGIQD